tara:strand:- start:2200 stop:3024 length:825 start_codon:yes stop_codon:yes gene_type:complete
MADKVSFTDFGEKKKVRKVRRRRLKKPRIDAEKLLDDVLAAKKVADDTIEASNPSLISLPFIEFSVTQPSSFVSGQWNTIEISLSNSGNGTARTITISFDNMQVRGQTIVDSLESGKDTVVEVEIMTNSTQPSITRLDLYYHSAEGDTFTAIRRDWFPNDNEDAFVFEGEIPPGEDPDSPIYKRQEVMHEEFHIICSNCGARAPTTFRICGKCGSRLQKRIDRRSDWGSNLKDPTGVEDQREVLIKKLRKLGELKDKGLLSDEEFTAAKAELLS